MLTPRQQKTALVVCADPSELKIISSLMKKLDFRVLTLPVQAASVNGLVECGDVIDLAIIDGDELGVMNPALLHSLHEKYPMVRFVFVSSETGGKGQLNGPAGHVRQYLPRPVRKAQLLGTILAVMDAPATMAA